MERKGFVLFLAVAISSFVGPASGCKKGGGGGGGLSDAVPPSDSYYPMAGVHAVSGKPVKVEWRYIIEGGKPLSTTVEGVPIVMSFEEAVVTIGAGSERRETKLRGKVSGEVKGSFSEVLRQDLVFEGPATKVEREEMKLDMKLAMAGESLHMVFSGGMDFDPPYEMFLDRDDLRQLGIGYREEEYVSGLFEGRLALSGFDPEDLSETRSGRVSWRIVEYRDSVTVQGKVYEDIVVVQTTQITPDMNLGEVNIKYWVARGVGMVRGEGVFTFLSKPLTVELVDTNLVIR